AVMPPSERTSWMSVEACDGPSAGNVRKIRERKKATAAFSIRVARLLRATMGALIGSLPLRQKIAGYICIGRQITPGGIANILGRDGANALGPRVDIFNGNARRQQRPVGTRHAGLAVAGEDHAAQKAVSGPPQFVFADALFGNQ